MTSALLPGETPAPGPLTAEEQDYLDRLIVRYRGRPGMLLNLLEEIQKTQPKKFLPLDYLEYLSSRTGIPAAQIYSVATFYALFNLKPQGRHTVCICRGTACHTRGSKALLDRLKLLLGLSEGEDGGSADKLTATTPDGEFTIRTVACFGQCALAPVVEVDHHILGHVNERSLEREVESVRKRSRS